MDIPADFFPVWFRVVCAVVWCIGIIAALSKVNFSAFQRSRRVQHIFFGTALMLSVLTLMRAGILPGLTIHMLGITAATMMMGWPLALLCVSLAHIVVVVAGTGPVWTLGVNGLFMGMLPVVISYCFWFFLVRNLPRNPFVFIMVGGFFNGAVTIAVTAVVISLLMLLSGHYIWDVIWHNYTRYLPLMMFPEGFLNGMFISGMVAFHPRWLSCFDEDSYFNS